MTPNNPDIIVSMPFRIALAVVVLGMVLVYGAVKAADLQSSDEAVAEMKQMIGKMPFKIQNYPSSAMAGGWALIKSTDMNKDTALSLKVHELIGLAVASQTPCEYCIYFHQKAARAAVASEEEVREAVHMASLVRHWSTVLYGNQSDFNEFKAEVDAAFKGK